MTLQERCDGSTNGPEFTVRNSKLPPGGGRAAGGGSSVGRRRRVATLPAQQQGAKWLAIVRLGGADARFAVQMGKSVTFVDGAVCLSDLLSFLTPTRGRSGDET